MMKSSGQEFNFSELAQEAQSRWLRPAEVLFILQNHEHHKLTSEPPHKPHSGSLFLFNRRILRYFRRDGHFWRKKRDGRAVAEAHERLKVGNVDALNCYYAHGEQNPNFQRRSYWMLDRDYEHIVLVHYREVAEGRHYSGSVSNLSPGSSAFGSESASILNAQNPGYASEISEVFESYMSSISSGSAEEVNSKFITRSDEIDHSNDTDISVDFGSPSKPEVNQALRRLTEQLSLDNDCDSLYYNSQDKNQGSRVLGCDGRALQQDTLVDLLHGLEYREQELNENSSMQDALNIDHFLHSADDPQRQHSQALGLESPSWKEVLELSSSLLGVDSEEKNLRTATVKAIPGDDGSNRANGTDYQISDSNLGLHLSMDRQFLLGNTPTVFPNPAALHQEVGKPELPSYLSETNADRINSSMGRLSKMNSIGWMETKQMDIGNSKYSSEYYNMWFDQESDLATRGAELGLTVAQIQRFSIREISPEWSYSTESSKVIITGDFLSDPEEFPWHCMFGDIEVPVEIIQKGVLRCRTPPHASGKVSLCITCGNRESCSEVREFEFFLKPNSHRMDDNLPPRGCASSTEEQLLLVRLAQMLLCGNTSPLAHKEYNVESKTGTSGHLKVADDPWERIICAVLSGGETPTGTIEWLLQELLKVQLEHWLSSKSREGELSGGSLTKQEKCIIHMIAGLGYEWALPPILNSGVGINFRDMHGWTALHWAARFGREKMVAALLAASASAGAVTDPTAQDPAGETAASIASDFGHKGLAAYLSEASLTSHLSSLTLEESDISKDSAAVEAERTVVSISERSSIQLSSSATVDQLSLKDSLVAVRNATQAAARIQSAFRSHSFRRRQQLAAASPDEYGMTQDDIHGISAALRNPRDHKLDKAALSIQKKYRGWKGRREFLFLRQNVVKIQAHVRGHQVRKKYKEVLWTVGVLEKVILRWRRRGVGLRGFRAEPESIDENEDDDILKAFRKQKVDLAIDQAVSRVLTMVESPEARHQYRRMLERYQQAKAELSCNASEVASSSHGISENMENNDDDLYQFLQEEPLRFLLN